ncbi:MAG: TIGR03619 family F420-dependent LLM class oxidoreductase [Pseudonocardiaceae bacterium]|nr:TIGR03619 family F420-dependent LLM class oxidoreductase [Pseudonocardiaceae bacterium]
MSVQFGLALENFTPASKEPDIDAVIEYATRAEELGFQSLWVWDHLFLGAKRPFPTLESLTTLAVLAAHTTEVTLGTGVLVLPVRQPAVLAKVAGTLQAASHGRLTLGMAAGWYEREFEATGTRFAGRGRLFERNLEVLRRLWEEDGVSGDYGDVQLRNVRMLPLPKPRPTVLIGGYVDRVLKRVATKSDGWLTYFYTAESFSRSWQKIRGFAAEAGRDPDELSNVAQLPLCIADSYEEGDAKVRAFVADYFDLAEWSESTADSAVRGTPEQCAEQIAAHLEAGSEHLVFAPYNYEQEQVERLASEVLPLVRNVPTGGAR